MKPQEFKTDLLSEFIHEKLNALKVEAVGETKNERVFIILKCFRVRAAEISAGTVATMHKRFKRDPSCFTATQVVIAIKIYRQGNVRKRITFLASSRPKSFFSVSLQTSLRRVDHSRFLHRPHSST